MLSENPIFVVYLAESLFAIFLGAMFFTFYRRYEREYLLLWAWSWWSVAFYWAAMFTTVVLGARLPVTQPSRIALSILGGITAYTHVVLLVAGAYRVSTQRPIPRKQLFAFLFGFGLLGGALSLGSLLTAPGLRRIVRVGLRAFVSSAAFLGASFALARSDKGPSGRKLVATMFGLLGVQHAITTIVSFGETLPAGLAVVLNQPSTVLFLVVSDLLLQVIMGLGLVIWLLEEEHAERVRVQEQLRQSQKLEALGLLAGGIAHDFNNHLTAILGYADLLGSRFGPCEPATKDVKEIATAANRASSLTRQLLAFNRKQVLQTQVLDVNEVASGMGAMLGRVIPASIQVSIDLAPEPALVRAEPSQLEQVLLNLALNARDAMPSSGSLAIGIESIRLDASVRARDTTIPPGKYVCISVRDSGVGMSRETLIRIFEPFFSTKPRESGTGLGLATVYGIVRRSRGHIVVESAVDVGTKFIVYLPQVDAVVEEPVEAGSGVTTRRGERLLLVEDDRAVRDIASKTLSSEGYDVRSASNGKEALDLARRDKEPFDLLVTDLVLPEIGGKGLAEALRRENPGLRVLYVSGYATEAIDIPARERNVAFLPKPFTGSELSGAVGALLASPAGAAVRTKPAGSKG